MNIKEIEYSCYACHVTHKRHVKWISPKEFSGNPTMKLTFWCPSCTLSNTVTVKFLKTVEEIKVLKVENSNLLQPAEENEQI